MRKYLAEGIGTFALVFCGTGAIVVNEVSGGTVGHIGIALTFGWIVTAMIYAFGNISGAHINPAVSIAFSFTSLFSRKDLLPYLLAQIIGAILASVYLSFLFPENELLGMTLPRDTWQQTFVLEIILTYFLMLVIIFVSQDRDVNKFTGLAVGGTVMLEAMFAGPITGASMNPARSIAPALVSGNINELWIYILAPSIGAIAASMTWKLMQKDH